MEEALKDLEQHGRLWRVEALMRPFGKSGSQLWHDTWFGRTAPTRQQIGLGYPYHRCLGVRVRETTSVCESYIDQLLSPKEARRWLGRLYGGTLAPPDRKEIPVTIRVRILHPEADLFTLVEGGDTPRPPM